MCGTQLGRSRSDDLSPAIPTPYSVAFTPDGHTLATGSSDKTVILWDVRDPARPQRIGRPLTGHTDAVNSVAFAPDGSILATGSNDHAVMLWDMRDPAPPQQIGPRLPGNDQSISPVAFSPDGRTLATGNADSSVALWDVRDPTSTAADRATPHRLHRHRGIAGIRSRWTHPCDRQRRRYGYRMGRAGPGPTTAKGATSNRQRQFHDCARTRTCRNSSGDQRP